MILFRSAAPDSFPHRLAFRAAEAVKIVPTGSTTTISLINNQVSIICTILKKRNSILFLDSWRNSKGERAYVPGVKYLLKVFTTVRDKFQTVTHVYVPSPETEGTPGQWDDIAHFQALGFREAANENHPHNMIAHLDTIISNLSVPFVTVLTPQKANDQKVFIDDVEDGNYTLSVYTNGRSRYDEKIGYLKVGVERAELVLYTVDDSRLGFKVSQEAEEFNRYFDSARFVPYNWLIKLPNKIKLVFSQSDDENTRKIQMKRVVEYCFEPFQDMLMEMINSVRNTYSKMLWEALKHAFHWNSLKESLNTLTREEFDEHFKTLGENINYKDAENGKTLLRYLCERVYAKNEFSEHFDSAYIDFLEYLIQKGADVNEKDENGNSPLTQLAARGRSADYKDVHLLLGNANRDTIEEAMSFGDHVFNTKVSQWLSENRPDISL